FRRAFAWAILCASALVAAWLSVGGVGGVSDVLTFRHATGWEVESTVGTFVWIATGGPVRMEAGARRIGTTTAASSAALVLILSVVFDPQRAVPAQVLLVCRNLLVVRLPLMWLVNVDHGPRGSSDERSSSDPVTGSRQTNR